MSQSSVPLSTDNRRPSSTARSRQSRVDSTSSSNRSAGLRSRPVIIVMTAAYLLLCFQVVQTRETIISAGAKAGQQTEDSRHCPPDASLISAWPLRLCECRRVRVCVCVCAGKGAPLVRPARVRDRNCNWYALDRGHSSHVGPSMSMWMSFAFDPAALALISDLLVILG